MSTIVAVKKNGLAVIASDTQQNTGHRIAVSKYVKNSSKIQKVHDSYVGVVGSSAHENVIRSISRKYPDKLCLTTVADIFESFVLLQSILKDEYFVKTDEDDDSQEYESNQLHALIANAHGIFEIQSYREVMEFNRFWAIGTGSGYALGAMNARFDELDDARKIARIGVQAGCEFDEGSGLPITYRAVKLKRRGRKKS